MSKTPALATPQKLPPPQPGEPPWMKFARAEYAANVREVQGPGVSPHILAYYTELGVKPSAVDDDGDPWCAVFASAMVKRAGFAPPARFRAARAFLEWGVPVDLRDAPPGQPAPFGAICVLWRERPVGVKGHVGFLVRVDGPQVWLLSGNSGNSVAVHAYPSFRVLGYRVARTA